MIHLSAEEQLRAQVRAALTHTKISQAEAARRLDLSMKHMSHMLTGRASLTLGWAERLLDLCGMRVVIAVSLHNQTDAEVFASKLAAGSHLTDTERQFLRFTIDVAADEIASRSDEFDDEDTAALEKLRRMADEA